MTTDEAASNETATSEEDLPEDFFDFEDSDHDQLEEVLDEERLDAVKALIFDAYRI